MPGGGFQYPEMRMSALLEEALPIVATSTQLFANAPVGTMMITLTLRTQGISMRFDGNVATVANGHDYAVWGTPHTLKVTQAQALLARAIQMGASATGWITYWGIA